jgi:transmembrane sensor
MMGNIRPLNPVEIPDCVAEFLAQKTSFSREAELQEWLHSDPSNRRILDECTDLWQGIVKARNKEDYDEKDAWKNIYRSIHEQRSETDRQKFASLAPVFKSVAAAAVTALVFCTAGYFVLRAYNARQHPSTTCEYIVPYGSKSRMTLPDGSVVWLNAGSKMVISSQFGLHNREIHLEGEAHFAVAHGKKPFLVKTYDLTIEALGTIFNVKAYPEEKVIETTVEEGAVELFDPVSGKSWGKNIVVRSNQRALYRIVQTKAAKAMPEGKTNPVFSRSAGSELKGKNETGVITMTRVASPEIYTSWKDEKWIIEREELQSLAVKLERRYNVRILFSDDKLRKYVFSGVLKDETLEQVLEYITLTAPIGYEVQHDRVTLYARNSLKMQLH